MASIHSGVGYLSRGLRQGKMSLTVVGVFIILFRMVELHRLLRLRRRSRVGGFRLRPGDKVGIAVSRSGGDPITFHTDPV